MNKRRLLKLADLLEADAKNKKGIKFDLAVVAVKSSYCTAVAPLTSEHNFQAGEVPTWDCGTAACAVGLALVSGAFKKQGLTYNVDTLWGVVPVFDGREGWGSAETAFFDVTDTESDFLFQTNSYPKSKTKGAGGERYVAKRIRDFVAGKVAPPEDM